MKVWNIFLTACLLLFFAFAVGCHTGKDAQSSQTSDRLSIQSKVEVYYVESPAPFSFRVFGTDWGTNLPVLIKRLQDKAVTQVVFRSSYKLTPEQIDRFVGCFQDAGIIVSEFWVPRSTFPSPVDVLSEAEAR